jgi:hypothetical protein
LTKPRPAPGFFVAFQVRYCSRAEILWPLNYLSLGPLPEIALNHPLLPIKNPLVGGREFVQIRLGSRIRADAVGAKMLALG